MHTRTRIVMTIAAAVLVAAFATPLAAASPTGAKRIDVPKSLMRLQEPGSTGYVPPTISYQEPGSTGYLAPSTASHAGAKPVDPLAVSLLASQGFSPSQIAALTASAPAAAPGKVDPLAVSYLGSLGLSPGEITDWTVGVCSHEARPASCFAAFDRVVPAQTVSSSGFDWADASIGAGATLGLLLLAIGLGFALVMHGQRRQTGRLGHA